MFDLKKDPDELINFCENPEYAEIAKRMKAGLIDQMKRHAEPAWENGTLILESGGSENTSSVAPNSEGIVYDAGGTGSEFK